MVGRHTFAGLDYLRLLAALLVVAYHLLFFSLIDRKGAGGIRDAIGVPLSFPEAVPFAWWGWIGVELFFVISGFVIMMSVEGKTAAEFAAGRVARIYPALLVCSLLTVAVVWHGGTVPASVILTRWIHSVLLLPVGPWIDGVIWTLTVEFVFYGLVFVGLLLRRPVRFDLYARGALTVISAYWLLVLLHHWIGLGRLGQLATMAATAFAARTFLLTTGSFFLLGIFSHEITARGPTPIRLALALLASVECLAAIRFRAIASPGVIAFGQNPLVPMAVWLAGIGILALSLVCEPRRQSPAKLARMVGLMTYPLYLVHEVVGGWVMGRLSGLGCNRWLAAGLTVMIAVAASFVFVIVLEGPLRRILGFNRLTAWARSSQATAATDLLLPSQAQPRGTSTS